MSRVRVEIQSPMMLQLWVLAAWGSGESARAGLFPKHLNSTMKATYWVRRVGFYYSQLPVWVSTVPSSLS